MKACRNFKFGNNVHNYLKNQEISRILKYFTFLWHLKGHKVRNKLVMKDFDKNLDTELDSWQIQKPCVCVHVRLIFQTRNFPLRKLKNCSSMFIPLTFDLDIFSITSILEFPTK